MKNTFDIFIIGGGINGTSILRDAVGRGLTVALCEKNDIGWATSSASTKLLHGGLRYLEHYEFRLVREALNEREILFKIAPHISWRMRFIFPYKKQLRPPILIRLGLFLYDHLAKLINIQGSKTINLNKHFAGLDLNIKEHRAFEYSDLGVLDSKFCLYNALDAKSRGAEVFVRKELISAIRKDNLWHLTLQNKLNNQKEHYTAKILINTTGPWINQVLNNNIQSEGTEKIRLIKGSHIIVPKIFDHNYCYILQNNDKRIVFAIPYEEDFTLIGTTEAEFNGDLDNVTCSEQEKQYLSDVINKYFKITISPADIIWDFAGARPIYSDNNKDATSATRDYIIKIKKDSNGKAILLNLFGGKITAAREIGEKVMNELAKYTDCSPSNWTRSVPLYGGDFGGKSFEQYLYDFKRNYRWIEHSLAKRLVRHYGSNSYKILGASKSYSDLGIHFGYNLYQKEVDYLIENELVYFTEDILLRRTRLILHLTKQEQDKLKKYVEGKELLT